MLGAEHIRIDEESRARAAGSWDPLLAKAKQHAAVGGGVGLPATAEAVVFPGDTESVSALVRWANGAKALLIPVGGASNVVGANAAPPAWAMAAGRGSVVAVDLARLNTVRWDEESLLVHAGAGVRLAALEEQLTGHDYTLGYLPQSLQLATVGGAVATNAVGLLSARYGRQRDLTVGLEAVLPNGDVIRTRPAPGASAAFDLHDLLIGSEGRLGIVTEATLRMSPVPRARAWAAFTFASFSDAVDAIRLIYRSDARPAFLRLFDPEGTTAPGPEVPLVDRGQHLLVLAFEGDELVQTGPYQVAYAICQTIGGQETAEDIGEAWLDANRAGTGAMAANGRPGGVADVLALSAPWSSLKAVEAQVRAAIEPLATRLEMQIGHAYPHGAALDVAFEAQAEPATPEAAMQLYTRITAAGLEAAHDAGASVTHHYGVGRTRREAFLRERGAAGVAALRAIKSALDPNGVLLSL
jgi:alkyldihydroxyacetonephosphate synthase